jgi:hypothetical protein
VETVDMALRAAEGAIAAADPSKRRTDTLVILAAASVKTYARSVGVSTEFLMSQLGAAMQSPHAPQALEARTSAMELVTASLDGGPDLAALVEGNHSTEGVVNALELVARWALVSCADDNGLTPGDFIFEVLTH